MSYFQRMPKKQDSLHQVLPKKIKIKINWNGLCIECHLKQARIQKTCGVTFKLALTPCWVSLELLMNYLIGLDSILIGGFITWISIKTDAVLLSRSTFILWESISFNSWNGPLSLALASFEPRKALVCYIASVFCELDERKRWKWKVWISLLLLLLFRFV